MVLSLERAVSLIDLRRTQRRVTALLMSDKQIELQKFPLRKRTLPPAVCYVCSRIDPNGIFRYPNDHLYRKGFFHACEDCQHASNTAIIKEELTKQDRNREDSLAELEESHTEKISVTIRRSSNSTKLHSSLKKDEIYESDISKISYNHRSPIDTKLQKEVSDYTGKKLSLPPIMPDKGGRLSEGSSRKSVNKSNVIKTPSIALTRLSRKSPFMSETLPAGSETESVSIGDHITIIPTGFDRTSAISGLSTFTEGTTPSKSTNDLDTKFASEEEESLPIGNSFTPLQSKHSVTTLPGQRSVTPMVDRNPSTTDHSKHTITSQSKTTRSTSGSSTFIDMFLKQSDGLQDVNRPGPPVREMALIEENRKEVPRPKAGHQRERNGWRQVTSEQSGSTDISESGHRSNDDQFIHPGSDIPQTQSEHYMEDKDSCSSKGVSDEASIIFSEQTADSSNPTERLGPCRCTTGQREISYSRNLCKICGKVYQLGNSSQRDRMSKQMHTRTSDTRASSSTRCLSTRQQMLQHDEAKMNSVRSKTFTDESHITRTSIRSKTSIDVDHMTIGTRRSKTTSEEDYRIRMHMQGSKQSPDKDYMNRINIRSKQTIDEDYMDMDTIIYEDDGRYWSSGEESPSPLPGNRHQHAHPYPLVNPDIHKVVYVQALQAVRAKGIKKIEDLDEMLRRPNVFSYIPLLPEKNRKETKYFGLRPDDSTKPKNRQLMKHIFGNVRPDDFYQEYKTDVVIDFSSNESSTENVNSGESPV